MVSPRLIVPVLVGALLMTVLVGASIPDAAPVSGRQATRVVDIAIVGGGDGFWVVDDAGHIHGTNAPLLGDVANGLGANESAVAVASTKTGRGYWILSDSGRVFTFGDAAHFGDASNIDLVAPVVDIGATPTGEGYFLVAQDGGVFGFGDALYVGAGTEFVLRRPINSLISGADRGYWLVGDDGGVLSFDVAFEGSAGTLNLRRPVVDATGFLNGYLLLGADGGVFNYAGGGLYGGLGARRISADAAAIAADEASSRYLIAQSDGVIWEFNSTTSSAPDTAGEIVAQIQLDAATTNFSPVRGAVGTRDFSSSSGGNLDAWAAAVPRSRSVRIPSSVDSNVQPAMWLPPPSTGRPLLVVLHSWSAGYDQQWSIPFAQWAGQNQWAMIAPHFRGVNKQPTATGSDLSIADVVDAIDYAVANGADPERVFITGFSGGGFMTLVMAGRHPELFAGAAAWVPVYDLPGWYNYNVVHAPWRHYIPHIEGSCGGAPLPGTAAYDDCVYRSPMSHLDAARAAGLPVYLATGLFDSLVPPSASARAFNQLAAPADRFTARQIDILSRFSVPPELVGQTDASLYFGPRDKPVVMARQSGSVTFVMFRGAHEMIYEPALRWFVEGPPSGGFGAIPSDDVCSSPTVAPQDHQVDSGPGHWLLDSEGVVHGFGAPVFGDLGNSEIRVVSIQSTSSGDGYWIADYAGVVRAFGDAVFHGDMRGVESAAPTQQIIANPAGSGYWLLGTDGGIFSFGDARFHGSAAALRLVAPIVSMEPTASGNGYWLVGEDGGVFSFGDAPFYGSIGGLVLQSPISSMAAAPDGSGY